MAAECGSTASTEGCEHLALLAGDNMAPALEKLLLVRVKDIGHFEPMFSHRLLPSSSGVKISRIASSSNGLCVACTLRTETWR